MYKIVGYYICEKLDIPNFLGIRGDELISVSGCFSGIHPDLTYCYFINDRKNERIEYHEKWNITEEKAIELQKDIHSIFESCLAIAAPIPELPPVTNAYLFLKFIIIYFLRQLSTDN